MPDFGPWTLDFGLPPAIMGILNLTPDSFSDGGRWQDAGVAMNHVHLMAAQGADIIDVGGESTRPGAIRIGADEQCSRVVPVIRRICAELDLPVSIDTTLATVAAACVDVGARIINDISAGRDDPAMFDLAAQRDVPLILMHMQGTPATMQTEPHYEDVVSEVLAFLLERAEAAQAAGVARNRIILDPGIGFGKTRDHNLSLLARLDRLVATGYPVLLGTSRRRFMGSICTNRDGTKPSPDDLLGATCASTALAVAAGVRLIRVHDVQANRQAADLAWALTKAS